MSHSDHTTLYEITGSVRAIIEVALAATTQEEVDECDRALADLDIALDERADAYAAVISEALGRASVRRSEARRMSDLVAADESLATRLKQRLMEAMQAAGKPRIDTPRFRLSVCGNGGLQSVTIDDPDMLPTEMTKIVRSPDTDRIRDALERGEAVHGCALVERGSHLRIK